MHKTVGVIINAASGADEVEQKVSALRDAFASQDFEPDFFLAHRGMSIKEVTQKAISKGHQLIAVAGGDGTINGVATELLNTEVCLGILPSGTFNHLARDLNIPLILSEAVEVLATGSKKMIDVASVNDRIFLNNSSIGVYSKLVAYRDDIQKRGWSKTLSLLQAIFSVLGNYSFLNVEINVHGQNQLFKTPLAFVGNNKYEVNGLSIGSRTSLEDGELCIYIVKHASRWDIIKLGVYAAIGRLHSHAQFESFAATAASFQTRKPHLKVAIDGEIVTLHSPLNYSIKASALGVMVPRVLESTATSPINNQD